MFSNFGRFQLAISIGCTWKFRLRGYGFGIESPALHRIATSFEELILEVQTGIYEVLPFSSFLKKSNIRFKVSLENAESHIILIVVYQYTSCLNLIGLVCHFLTCQILEIL